MNVSLWLTNKTENLGKTCVEEFNVWKIIFNETVSGEWKRDLLLSAINVDCIIFHSATKHENCRMLMRACFHEIIFWCRCQHKCVFHMHVDDDVVNILISSWQMSTNCTRKSARKDNENICMSTQQICSKIAFHCGGRKRVGHV